MSNVLEKPTAKEQQIAKEYLEAASKLAKVFAERQKSVAIAISDQEEAIHLEVPPKVFQVLKDVLSLMAEGKAFSVIGVETTLTTQQAAEMLAVSRPHLVKMIDSGQLPFHKVGRHRRVYLKDVLLVLSKREEDRESALEALAAQAQELNMGY
jgi:excisionase family DNA binding protein